MSVSKSNEWEIESKEMMFSVSSMILSVGILTLPRDIASTAHFFDGWISIAIGGIASLAFVWILSTLASSFPKQSYFEYTSLIVSKPVGYVLTGFFAVSYIMFTAYEVRSLAEVAKHYLFTKTPIEFIALCFLFILIYAVGGSRVGLLRLNMLFFPIVIVVFFLVLLLNVGVLDLQNYKPMLVSDWKGIVQGAQASSFSFLGFEIVLVYSMYLRKPKQAVKASLAGTLFPFAIYLILYFFIIGVFSYKTTMEIDYPTVELAKEVEVPGAFFERFESFFFTIWIMTIFNTSAMGYDICLISLDPLFPGLRKIGKILMLAPLIFILSFIPQDRTELTSFGSFVSLSVVGSCIILPVLIFIVFKWRGVRTSG